MDDFYDLLEVPENASSDDIKAAWREKAREYHPDVNDDSRSTAQFKTLKKAYEVLSDETERSAYDRMGHAAYVSERLDGLPTAGMTRPSNAGGNRWQTASRSAGSSGSGRSSSSSSSSSASRSSASSASARSSTSSTRSSTSSTSTGSSASSAGSTRSSSSSSSTSSASSSTGTRNSRSSRSRSRRSADRSSGGRTSDARNRSRGRTDRDAGESASAAETAEATADGGSTRSPLWYAWTAVFLAGVGYAAGLAVYLRSNLDALSALASAATADPAAALSASHGLTPPGAFVLGTVAAPPSVGLAFPAGAALLALVFVGTVAKFGRGTAYLYLAGAFAPLGAFSFGTAVAVEPSGATLALLVVLPLAATLLFLGDVGRFLLSDR